MKKKKFFPLFLNVSLGFSINNFSNWLIQWIHSLVLILIRRVKIQVGNSKMSNSLLQQTWQALPKGCQRPRPCPLKTFWPKRKAATATTAAAAAAAATVTSKISVPARRRRRYPRRRYPRRRRRPVFIGLPCLPPIDGGEREEGNLSKKPRREHIPTLLEAEKKIEPLFP